LSTLGGLERRFQVKGEMNNIMVVDDYGHHPAEIAATLETARECWQENRIIVVFQPHRYTRTKALYDRFVVSFNQADILVVAPIYAAGEKPIEGVDSAWLHQGIKERGHKEAHLGGSHDEILQFLLKTVRPGDRVITLGAGDVYRLGEELLEKMQG